MNPGGPPWQMYASVRPTPAGEQYGFFGPIGFALQDALATRVALVLLEPTDDPGPQDYWAWLDTDGWQPTCIHPTEEQMTAQFLLDQTDAPGPREEEKVGLGKILRLRVTELPEEVYLRETTRHKWRISSAM